MRIDRASSNKTHHCLLLPLVHRRVLDGLVRVILQEHRPRHPQLLLLGGAQRGRVHAARRRLDTHTSPLPERLVDLELEWS